MIHLPFGLSKRHFLRPERALRDIPTLQKMRTNYAIQYFWRMTLSGEVHFNHMTILKF